MKLYGKIWLQPDEEHGEPTWCQDKINDDDVEYVRADLFTKLEEENEKRILYGAELAQERNDLKKENKVLRELLKQANKFNVLSKIESAPAWDSDSPFQQEIDALLTGE